VKGPNTQLPTGWNAAQHAATHATQCPALRVGADARPLSPASHSSCLCMHGCGGGGGAGALVCEHRLGKRAARGKRMEQGLGRLCNPWTRARARAAPPSVVLASKMPLDNGQRSPFRQTPVCRGGDGGRGPWVTGQALAKAQRHGHACGRAAGRGAVPAPRVLYRGAAHPAELGAGCEHSDQSGSGG
jgi:hypothetical protein